MLTVILYATNKFVMRDFIIAMHASKPHFANSINQKPSLENFSWYGHSAKQQNLPI